MSTLTIVKNNFFFKYTIVYGLVLNIGYTFTARQKVLRLPVKTFAVSIQILNFRVYRYRYRTTGCHIPILFNYGTGILFYSELSFF